MKNIKNLIIYCIIFFQIILKINCQQNDFPMERSFHTAILIDKKIFFFGGKSNDISTNDFFLF
jgi:hypothetical protein